MIGETLRVHQMTFLEIASQSFLDNGLVVEGTRLGGGDAAIGMILLKNIYD